MERLRLGRTVCHDLKISPKSLISFWWWRKGWDSNPRYPCRHAGFQDRCLKPLGHPSKPLILLRNPLCFTCQRKLFARLLLPVHLTARIAAIRAATSFAATSCCGVIEGTPGGP